MSASLAHNGGTFHSWRQVQEGNDDDFMVARVFYSNMFGRAI
jgi:hypothetical protein